MPEPTMPNVHRLLVPALLATLVSACSAQQTRPTRADAQVLTAPPVDWSALAGRQVRVDAPLTITGNHRLAGDGEVLASFDGRLRAPTEVAAPGAAAAAMAAANARRSLVLALPAPRTDTPGAYRSGGRFEGASGTVEVDADGAPRLRLDAPAAPRAAERPPVPVVAGDVRLASLNLHNLFNGDGRGGGFPTARGARTESGYLVQRARLVAALEALDADIVALMELENDGFGPASSVAQLVAALDADGTRQWRFVDTAAGPGDNPIRVGMLYRADRVVPVGAPAMLETGVFGPLSRVPLAQAFRAGSGPAFTVVANHFKSKGCRDAAGPDLDQGDGQSCWNATRVESARLLDAWLRSDPTRSGTALVAVLGDLNAYALEDPVRALVDAGWRDALAHGAGDTYTYVYDGQAGRLDHALLSPGLAAHLQGAAVWHANADEAANSVDPADNTSVSDASPWRSSDHDPVLVGLRLRGR
jgi:uncharacterized protein